MYVVQWFGHIYTYIHMHMHGCTFLLAHAICTICTTALLFSLKIEDVFEDRSFLSNEK